MTTRQRPVSAPRPRQAEPTRSDDADPALDAESFLVEAIGVLHANGAETDRAERRTAQLARALGLTVRADLGWSYSDFSFEHEDGTNVIRRSAVRPDGLALNRVLAVDRVINELEAGTLTLADAWGRLRAAGRLPVANVFLFALACMVGGCGLAVVFGVRHGMSLVLIAACCGIGAFVRRGLGHLGATGHAQVAAAALLAGLSGAASAGLEVGSPLGLAAVCPCMILVPGPHLLKGVLDVTTLRIPLGAARLLFGFCLLTAITAGLLVGLWIGRADLVSDPAGRDISVWIDAPTAGLLAVAYGIFYSAPLRILYWPLLAGAAAHALRWLIVEHWHGDLWIGAGVACLFVGLVLIPVCERFQLPFSALGFASVVSLVPGVLVFRALAGFSALPSQSGAAAQRLVVEIADNASTAALTMVAMPLGFLLAGAVWSRTDLWRRRVLPADGSRTR